jgi:DNA-binding MurR/RpiR family transcriptional regulator
MDSVQNPASEHAQTLEARIAASHADLSNKQKRLARFVLDNKYFISFATANQAGEETGTSAATVVRFAQTIGYQGYSEMQAAIRAELPNYMRAIDQFQERLEATLQPDDVANKVFLSDISNIERTAKGLSEATLNEAVEAIMQAEHIFVVGAGLSAAPAFLLSHSLRLIGLDVHLNQGEGLSLAVDAAIYRPGDVLIAIGIWRYARSTVNTVMKAKGSGLYTITITDSVVSPLSRISDCAFEVFTDGISYNLSITAIISMLNVLISALSFRVPEQVFQSLRKVDRAYLDNDLLALE